MTPRQAREWCDRELAREKAESRLANLDYAADRYERAQRRGDDARAGFWAAVRSAVADGGADLRDAMQREADRRNGPLRPFRDGFGNEHMVRDLEWWE